MRGTLLELAEMQIADRQREMDAEHLARLAGKSRTHSPKFRKALQRFSRPRRQPTTPTA